jgi:hypothetical protein
MKSMLRIPSGARTLVHKSGLIPWLTMQWDMSFSRPSRGAGEERRRYLDLLELAVIGCVAGDVERAKKASEASGESGASGASGARGIANGLEATMGVGVDEKEKENGEKAGQWLYPKPWVLDTGTLLKRAIPEAGEQITPVFVFVAYPYHTCRVPHGFLSGYKRWLIEQISTD